MQDIAIKKKHSMKSPTPETQCAECIFQKQYPICAVNFDTLLKSLNNELQE